MADENERTLNLRKASRTLREFERVFGERDDLPDDQAVLVKSIIEAMNDMGNEINRLRKAEDADQLTRVAQENVRYLKMLALNGTALAHMVMREYVDEQKEDEEQQQKSSPIDLIMDMIRNASSAEVVRIDLQDKDKPNGAPEAQAPAAP